MRHYPAALLVLVIAHGLPVPAFAQRERPDPAPFSVADITSVPFATELVAAPDGRKVAWIGYEEGKRNIWVAEEPAFRARRLTRYSADDGQPISALTWTRDSRALLYVRGGAPGSNWSVTVPVNPTSDPAGADQSVWMVPIRAGVPPRKVGDGHTPLPSPAGDLVAFILRDTIRVAPLRVAGPPRVLLRERGQSAQPAWSPDGRQLAFTSRRNDHSFIGVYDVARNTVRWVAAGTWRDDTPRWSPDGGRLSFVRRPGQPFTAGLPLPPVAGTAPPAFTIQVADLSTGVAREAWRPAAGEAGLPGLAGSWGLGWANAETLLFASEMTGWLGLYRVSASGGEAVRLTPDSCEIRDVVPSDSGASVTYASNCGDIDRMHVQRVPVAGGGPVSITSGTGIEWAPAPLAGGRLALLRSDAHRPARPALSDAADGAGLDGWPLPSAFPIEQLVEPEQVIVRAADSTPIHLQVFVPQGGVAVRRPAVLFFHGGPQRQMLLGWHDRGYYHNAYALNQYLASRGFVVVSVNYRGGIGYGRAFREAPRRGRFGASEYQDVLAAAAWLRARPDVDSARIGLWGGSYGGYLTALGLARNSDLFAAGVDLHGVHDYAITRAGQPTLSDSAAALARRSSAVGDVVRWHSPVLLIHGDDDRNVEFQQTTDLALRLRRRGVQVEELVFPDDVHGFLRHANWVAAYRAAAEFFARTLGTRAAVR